MMLWIWSARVWFHRHVPCKCLHFRISHKSTDKGSKHSMFIDGRKEGSVAQGGRSHWQKVTCKRSPLSSRQTVSNMVSKSESPGGPVRPGGTSPGSLSQQVQAAQGFTLVTSSRWCCWGWPRLEITLWEPLGCRSPCPSTLKNHMIKEINERLKPAGVHFWKARKVLF